MGAKAVVPAAAAAAAIVTLPVEAWGVLRGLMLSRRARAEWRCEGHRRPRNSGAAIESPPRALGRAAKSRDMLLLPVLRQLLLLAFFFFFFFFFFSLDSSAVWALRGEESSSRGHFSARVPDQTPGKGGGVAYF